MSKSRDAFHLCRQRNRMTLCYPSVQISDMQYVPRRPGNSLCKFSPLILSLLSFSYGTIGFKPRENCVGELHPFNDHFARVNDPAAVYVVNQH